MNLKLERGTGAGATSRERAHDEEWNDSVPKPSKEMNEAARLEGGPAFYLPGGQGCGASQQQPQQPEVAV